MKKIIVYGDPHGCLDEFLELRNKIKPSSIDREIIIGDILDKGPNSIELLRFVRKNNIESIVGNHEDKYLRYKKHYDLFIEKGINIPMNFQEEKILIFNTLNQEDLSYLESLPYFIRIDNLTLVHGGVTNDMNLNKLSNKDIKMIIRLRYLQEDNKISHTAHKNAYNIRWAELYNGSNGVIVYGHESYDEVKYDNFAIGIDTGCVYGNKLSAIVISDSNDPMNSHEIIQVNSKISVY